MLVFENFRIISYKWTIVNPCSCYDYPVGGIVVKIAGKIIRFDRDSW